MGIKQMIKTLEEVSASLDAKNVAYISGEEHDFIYAEKLADVN